MLPDEVPDVIPAALDAYLKEQGAVLGERMENGGISVKAAWVRDRRATGVLKVTGKRVHPAGGRFSADVNRLYGGKKFARIVPSQLRMSGPGCWRIRARAGSARVTYLVRCAIPSPPSYERRRIGAGGRAGPERALEIRGEGLLRVPARPQPELGWQQARGELTPAGR
ncbi:MAG TPA: hypothetical protein VNT03_05310 [Baekduia sp.]|nr:hypothetical protein [Baekduia sp.]